MRDGFSCCSLSRRLLSCHVRALRRHIILFLRLIEQPHAYASPLMRRSRCRYAAAAIYAAVLIRADDMSAHLRVISAADLLPFRLPSMRFRFDATPFAAA